MQWPFKTTVRFAGRDGNVIRFQYAVSAMSVSEAKIELERRLLGQEAFGYVVEEAVAATARGSATETPGRLRLVTGLVHR